MSEFEIKLPDVGEGIAEAELVEWSVAVGDLVCEDDILCAVMTDKATVEIPSLVDGVVLSLGAEIGDAVPVGSVLIRLDAGGGESPEPPEPQSGNIPLEKTARQTLKNAAQADPRQPSSLTTALKGAPPREGDRPLASPPVRLRARESGIDLREVAGTGPGGRIVHGDLDEFLLQSRPAETDQPQGGGNDVITEVKVVGLRRKIAEKMTISKSRIPHITIVEEIDVSALEELREQLNQTRRDDQEKLTILPFMMAAMVIALKTQPTLNALYDDEKNVIQQHSSVHIGIAVQTPGGLLVPVVRHCENRDIWSYAAEVKHLGALARSGDATLKQLSGSTITITSLGALGGIATTPVINYPEVAIIGINKIAIRPVWHDDQFIPRKMMNLSASFDHRVIDGWEAATFLQKLKALLETPLRIFVERAE